MAEKKIYIGSVGPYLFEDDELIEDTDGAFSGELRRAFVTDHQIYVGGAPSGPYDVSRYTDLLSGWLSINTTHITDDYTVLAADQVLLVDCSSWNIVITLLAGVVKKSYEIVRIDNSEFLLTVRSDGTETINGEIEQILYAESDAMKIISNGSNWYIL